MPRPLKKRDQEAKPYVRRPEIEAIIDANARLSVGTLIRRSHVHNPWSPEFLPSECLVYFIRDAWRRGDDQAMGKLLPSLMRRCDVILRSRISPKYLQNFTEECEDILSRFTALFVEDDSGGNADLDYFECNFNAAFRAFYIDCIRPELKHSKRRVPLHLVGRVNEVGSEGEERLSRLSHSFAANKMDTEDIALRNICMCHLFNAIAKLPSKEQTAVILCYFLNIPEESGDPLKNTAATLCRVTGRTIRNRLTRAATRLSRLDPEQ